jgi:hypothetical protein
VVSSADGNRLFAFFSDEVWVSTNSGLTWSGTSTYPESWVCLASSADGTKLVAGGQQGIYINSYPKGSGGPWRQANAPSAAWWSLASSADGNMLLAAANELSPNPIPGAIYGSTNSGTTWAVTSSPHFQWFSVDCSTNGSNVVAVGFDPMRNASVIYTSADSGATWLSNSVPNEQWTRAVCSADGAKLVVVAFGPGTGGGLGGPIAVSTNSGVTWTEVSGAPPFIQWHDIASSADGSKLVALGSSGIYTSADSGIGWTSNSAPFEIWRRVASSADGTRLVASALVYDVSQNYSSGPIYASTNSGVTWTLTGAPYENWTSIASSSDGSRLVAAGGDDGLEIPGPIYVSANAGLTWTLTSAPLDYWCCVASSADGSKLVAATHYGKIYTWQEQPSLNIVVAANKAIISWTALSSSTDFVLQENSDLNVTNWLDITTHPAITNSQKQVILPVTGGKKYYRLKAL